MRQMSPCVAMLPYLSTVAWGFLNDETKRRLFYIDTSS